MLQEIKHNMIEPIKSKQTLAQSEIQDGDIITVQKTYSDKEYVDPGSATPSILTNEKNRSTALASTGKITDCREYYDNLLHKIKVRFAPKFDVGADFDLDLSKRMTYNTMCQKVAEALGPDVQADHLRFSPVNAHTGRPKIALRHTTTANLGTILQPGYNSYGQAQNQRTDALYYEILEVSMTELETRKNIKITWLPDGIHKEEPYEILVPKNGTVEDVVSGLQRKATKASISDEALPRIRVFETHANKIYRAIEPTLPVTNLSEFSPMYAELIPEGEAKNEIDEETEAILPAFQFDKEISKAHGVPFYFLIKKDEVFKDTKERLSKRTGIKGKQFERIKFAVIPRSAYGKTEYLEDGESCSS